MSQQFFIVYHMKIKGELQSFATFEIGNDREAANALFRQLKGSSDTAGDFLLYVELTETIRNLPANIRIIACTLDELSENCRIIAKALFRRNSMDLLH